MSVLSRKYIPRWPRILTIGICIALLIALVAWILYDPWHNWDKLDLAALIVGTGVLVLVALAWKFPIARVPVVAGGVVVWLWFAWILAQTLNIGFATKYVSEMQEAILKKPCDLAVGYPKLVLEGDGGEQIRPPGVRITCSERFCGFHDGTNAIVVSLEGVKSMRTELPAGCEQKSPAKAAEGG